MRLLLALFLSVMLHAGAHAMGGGGGGGRGDTASDGDGNRVVLIFNRPGAEDEGDDADHGEEEGADNDPRSFNLPALVAPLSRDGRLTGFAYVQVRIRAADGQNVWSMQENAHYALDALVRAAYRNPVSSPDGRSLDVERAEQVWAGVLREQYGADAVDRVEIRGADTRMLNR